MKHLFAFLLLICLLLLERGVSAKNLEGYRENYFFSLTRSHHGVERDTGTLKP